VKLPAAGHRSILAIVAFFSAVIVLRFAALETEGLWVDEGYTYLLTSESPEEMVRSLGSDDAPPLFYLVLKYWNALLESLGLELSPEAAVRILPALASALAVVFLALFRSPARGAWPLLLLMGFSSYAVFYGRQGRSYGWVLLWVVLVFIAAMRIASGKRWGSALLLAVSLSILLWSHNLGIVVWASGLLAFLSLLLRARRKGKETGPWARGLAAHAAALVSSIPWHVMAGNQLAYHAFSNRWMADYWTDVPIPFAPILSLVVFGPGSPVSPPCPANLPRPLADGEWILCLIVTVAFLILALWGLTRWAHRNTTERYGPSLAPLLLAVAYLAGPLILTLGVSLLWTPSYVLGRTDLVAFPAFAFLAGLGLMQLRRSIRWVALALSTAISIAVVLPLLGVGTSARLKVNDRNLARSLSGEIGRGDLLVHTALTAPALESYLHAWETPHQFSFYPPSQALNPAASPSFSMDSLDTYRSAALSLRSRLESGEVTRLLTLVRLRPGIPPTGARTAEDLVYPQSVLAFVLGGMEPLPVLTIPSDRGEQALIYRHDWIGGDRMVLAYELDDLVDLNLLGDIEVKR
jgi:hypothetical protein